MALSYIDIQVATQNAAVPIVKNITSKKVNGIPNPLYPIISGLLTPEGGTKATETLNKVATFLEPYAERNLENATKLRQKNEKPIRKMAPTAGYINMDPQIKGLKL